MAQISLGESRWRMIRRTLPKKRFRYEDTRNMTRTDPSHFEWLVTNGFFADAGSGWYELTEKGKHSAELGMYEWEPERPAAAPLPRQKGKR